MGFLIRGRGRIMAWLAGKLDVEFRVGPIGGSSAPAAGGGHMQH